MKSSELQLDMISAEKKIFSDKVQNVIVPGISGKFGVLPGHAPLISTLKKGVVEYAKNGKTESIEVGGGVIEVNNNVVTICVV